MILYMGNCVQIPESFLPRVMVLQRKPGIWCGLWQEKWPEQYRHIWSKWTWGYRYKDFWLLFSINVGQVWVFFFLADKTVYKQWQILQQAQIVFQYLIVLKEIHVSKQVFKYIWLQIWLQVFSFFIFLLFY